MAAPPDDAAAFRPYTVESHMNAQEAVTGRWELTDEEWCELCFMVIDMNGAREELEKTLLARERPTLNQLYVAMSAYRQVSDSVFDYLSGRLRQKARIESR